MFVSGADMLIMTPILPQVAAELGVDVSLGGLWVTAYGGATAVFALLFGPVSDAKGRKLVLAIGMAVLAFGTLLCGLATNFGTMMGARVIAGAGAGMLVTSTTSFVGDHFDDQQRAIAMGYVMGGFFASLILGVPIGATLTGWVGWKAMFFVFAGATLLVFFAIAVLLPQPRHEVRTGEVHVTSALEGYWKLMHDRKVLGVLMMSMSIGISMVMFSVYTSPWLELKFGLNTTERGLTYAIGGPAVILGGPLAGRISNALGRVRVVVGGTIMMALMQWLIPNTELAAERIRGSISRSDYAQFGDVAWPIVAPTLLVFFLIMIAGSSRSAPFQTLAIEIVSPEQRGALAAVRNSFNQAGGAAGAALGGFLWAGTTGSYHTICYAAAVIGLLGAVLMRGLVGPGR